MSVDCSESEYQNRDENLRQTNEPNPGKTPHDRSVGHVGEYRHCESVASPTTREGKENRECGGPRGREMSVG